MAAKSSVSFIYVTAPSLKIAKQLAHSLLNDRLIACANIFPKIHSIYHWQEKLESSSEVVIIFKTRKTLFNKCVQKIELLHPYKTPCILELPIPRGNSKYLNWLKQETSLRI